MHVWHQGTSSTHSCMLAQMLQLEGQPADTSDFEGRSALMLACMAGHRDIALALLGAGADAGLRDRDGATPLLKAVRNGHDSTINLLRSCGAECAPPLVGSTCATPHLWYQTLHASLLNRLHATPRLLCGREHAPRRQCAMHHADVCKRCCCTWLPQSTIASL